MRFGYCLVSPLSFDLHRVKRFSLWQKILNVLSSFITITISVQAQLVKGKCILLLFYQERQHHIGFVRPVLLFVVGVRLESLRLATRGNFLASLLSNLTVLGFLRPHYAHDSLCPHIQTGVTKAKTFSGSVINSIIIAYFSVSCIILVQRKAWLDQQLPPPFKQPFWGRPCHLYNVPLSATPACQYNSHTSTTATHMQPDPRLRHRMVCGSLQGTCFLLYSSSPPLPRQSMTVVQSENINVSTPPSWLNDLLPYTIHPPPLPLWHWKNNTVW